MSQNLAQRLKKRGGRSVKNILDDVKCLFKKILHPGLALFGFAFLWPAFFGRAFGGAFVTVKTGEPCGLIGHGGARGLWHGHTLEFMQGRTATGAGQFVPAFGQGQRGF